MRIKGFQEKNLPRYREKGGEAGTRWARREDGRVDPRPAQKITWREKFKWKSGKGKGGKK